MALWDLAGRAADVPAWQLLGGFREAIPAYASTPTFASTEEFLDVASRARASRDRMLQAIRGIPESRGLWTVKSMLGLVTVYQVGEWATAHVARHNAQAKRAIG